MHLLPALSRFLLFSTHGNQGTNTFSLGDTGREVGAVSESPAGDLLRRNEKIAAERPVQGVRKMSTDEGEKFFFDYWQFGDDPGETLLEREVQEEGNSTLADLALASSPDDPEEPAEDNFNFPDALFLARSYAFQPAFSLETRSWSKWRNPLAARDFKCPTGTNACTSIGRSDRCCGTGDTCEIVPDTGSGDVGCCPAGESCNGGVGSCQAGYTGCSQALGGGCCIPDYDCVPGGCEYYPNSWSSVMLSDCSGQALISRL